MTRAQQRYVVGAEYDLGGGNLGVWDGKNFVATEEYVTRKARAGDQLKIAQMRLGQVDAARNFLDANPDKATGYWAAMDAGEIKPPGIMSLWRSPDGRPGTPGYTLDRKLLPLRSNVFRNEMETLKAQSPTGASGLGAASDAEGRRLESALGSLYVGMRPEDLRQNLQVVRDVMAQRTPGLTPANPLDLTAGQSRDAAPRDIYYRSPDGATRKNVSGDAGNAILWTPGGNENPQKPRLDARLAWNDAWFQRNGNMKGAEEAFNRWWATYSKANPEKATKAFPGARTVPPPPRANADSGVIRYDAQGNRIR